MKAQLSFFHDNGKFEATHEIEIPDGATLFQYQTNKGDLYHFYREEGICSYGHFPIPRPKKIKKWIYEFVCKGITWRSACPISEAEYASQPMTGHKMPETMIEAEE